MTSLIARIPETLFLDALGLGTIDGTVTAAWLDDGDDTRVCLGIRARARDRLLLVPQQRRDEMGITIWPTGAT